MELLHWVLRGDTRSLHYSSLGGGEGVSSFHGWSHGGQGLGFGGLGLGFQGSGFRVSKHSNP